MMSSDLVHWVSTDPWIEKHLWDWTEDVQTGVWMDYFSNTTGKQVRNSDGFWVGGTIRLQQLELDFSNFVDSQIVKL